MELLHDLLVGERCIKMTVLTGYHFTEKPKSEPCLAGEAKQYYPMWSPYVQRRRDVQSTIYCDILFLLTQFV